jgi:hypothetical protein
MLGKRGGTHVDVINLSLSSHLATIVPNELRPKGLRNTRTMPHMACMHSYILYRMLIKNIHVVHAVYVRHSSWILLETQQLKTFMCLNILLIMIHVYSWSADYELSGHVPRINPHSRIIIIFATPPQSGVLLWDQISQPSAESPKGQSIVKNSYTATGAICNCYFHSCLLIASVIILRVRDPKNSQESR